MKKQAVFIRIFSVLLILGCSCSVSAQPTTIVVDLGNSIPNPENMRAFDYFNTQKIQIGWNLGNALDSYKNIWDNPIGPIGASGNVEIIGDETYWNSPVISQAIMDGIKNAGFDIIRIPVTWQGHIGPAPNYTITPARLNRVAETVKMARKAGLKVILNLHHDDRHDVPDVYRGWLDITKASSSTAEETRITDKYEKVWRQIATHFRDYGEWLMFEAFNEIRDDNNKSTPSETNRRILNKWNQAFTNVVRSSGGNNTNVRYLIVSWWYQLTAITLNDYNNGNFVLPADTVPNRLVVSFHYYSPWPFCNGSTPNFGPADYNEAIHWFDRYKNAFINNNIPVIIGECGAARQGNHQDPAILALAHKNRVDWYSHLVKTAKTNGLVPIFWDTPRDDATSMGLFNRSTGQPQNAGTKEILDAAFAALK
jgi:endoglucanase